MKVIPSNPLASQELEKLLCRGDIWRGQARGAAPRMVLDSGYEALNQSLLDGGLPLGSLIEVCQPNGTQAEWLLLMPSLLRSSKGLLVLLNPPCDPFAQALMKVGVDLDRILIVESRNKNDFLSSFIELTRAEACDAVLAWQPKQSLSYTELRKCLLASAEGLGLYVLFRPASVAQQSSPASLRLSISLQAQALQVSIFKQKGELGASSKPVLLPLPTAWQGLMPHCQLGQNGKAKPGIAKVTPLYGHQRNRK